MKRFFFLLLITSLSTLPASSQTHFITAGQTQGMIFTDYVPDYIIPTNYFQQQTDTGSINIDLNRDSIDDFTIYKSAGGSHVTVTDYKIICLNQNSVMTKLDSARDFNAGDTTSLGILQLVAKKYSEGDTMISSNGSIWSNGNIFIEESTWLFASSILTDYILPTDTSYYYLVKIVTGSDTLLGYIHFSTKNILLDVACEGPTSSYIISSTNDLTNTPNILVSPNPFTNQINISTDKPFNYQITDYTGRIVLQGRAENNIQTGVLAAGNYLLLIKNEETYSVKKITKIK